MSKPCMMKKITNVIYAIRLSIQKFTSKDMLKECIRKHPTIVNLVQGRQAKFPDWFGPLLLWPQRLHNFDIVCFRYLDPQPKYKCMKTCAQPSHISIDQFLVQGVKICLSAPSIYFHVLRLFKVITSIFYIKLPCHNQFYSFEIIFRVNLSI